MPYWKLYYHIVWGTKDRLPLIEPDYEADLYRAIVAKAQELESIVHAVGGTQDHIHLAVSVPPKVAMAPFIGAIKGNSSHFVNHVVQPGFQFNWQDEYGVLSFSEKNLSASVKNIHNQKKHHVDGSVVGAMELFLPMGDSINPESPGDQSPG
jgi:putative transposase